MADVINTKPELAKYDCVVTDSLGVSRKVFAGRPIPPVLLDAYNAAKPEEPKPKPTPEVTKAEDSPEVTTIQEGPEVNKAQVAPEVRKSSRRKKA